MNPRSHRGRSTPLRTRQRAEVARDILDAAEEVIAERGLSAASLAAIGARAGVAVGTLYNYHRDRDDLVRNLFAARREEMVPRLLAATHAHADLAFPARLRAFVREVLAVFDAHRRFVKVAMEAEHLKATLPGGARSPRPPLGALIEGLAAVLDAGIAEGAIAGGQRDLQAALLAGMIRAAIRHRMDSGNPLDLDADPLVDLFLRGAPAGHREASR